MASTEISTFIRIGPHNNQCTNNCIQLKYGILIFHIKAVQEKRRRREQAVYLNSAKKLKKEAYSYYEKLPYKLYPNSVKS